MTQIKKYFATLAAGIFAMALTPGAFAEGPTISGFIDTTYNYNLNRPDSQTNALRSFDGHADSFHLNTAHLSFTGEAGEGIGYVIETDYGTDAAVSRSADVRDINGDGVADNQPDQFDIQEAYLTYKCPHTGAVLKGGKFATYEGIEVIESPSNFTITRGFLFGMVEPFTHTGFAATYALPQVVDLSAGVVNGWDRLNDNNRAKTFIWRVGLDFGDVLSGGLSGTYGPEERSAAIGGYLRPLNTKDRRASFDATFVTNPIAMLSIALQGNYGYDEKILDRDGNGIGDTHAQWFGFGIQPKVDIGEKCFVGVRYEFLQDDDGAAPAGPGNGVKTIMQNITIAPGHNLTENIMFRAEYRYDWHSKGAGFLMEDSAGVMSKRHQSTIGAELVYSF